MASIVGYFVLSGAANILIIGSYDGRLRKNQHIRSLMISATNYNRAHAVVACMALGIVVFGGLVVYLWALVDGSKKVKTTAKSKKLEMIGSVPAPKALNSAAVLEAAQIAGGGSAPVALDGDREPPPMMSCGSSAHAHWSRSSGAGAHIHFGSRPNWKDVFDGLAKSHHTAAGGDQHIVDVGVLVSGSQSMQADVARECRSRHSIVCRRRNISKLPDHDHDCDAYKAAADVIFHYHSISFSL